MLLKNNDEILDAMNKELTEASASSIKWLAGTFNVPLGPEKKRDVPSVSAKKETVHPRKNITVVRIPGVSKT
jgi:hypothetical protein